MCLTSPIFQSKGLAEQQLKLICLYLCFVSLPFSYVSIEYKMLFAIQVMDLWYSHFQYQQWSPDSDKPDTESLNRVVNIPLQLQLAIELHSCNIYVPMCINKSLDLSVSVPIVNVNVSLGLQVLTTIDSITSKNNKFHYFYLCISIYLLLLMYLSNIELSLISALWYWHVERLWLSPRRHVSWPLTFPSWVPLGILGSPGVAFGGVP